jgi:acyl-CoA dehydrogenase
MAIQTSHLSETGQLVEDTATRIMRAHCSAEKLKQAEGAWSEPLWRDLEDAGLPRALESSSEGVMGIPIPEALHILRIAGKFSTPVPLAESMLANWLIASTGLPSIGGPLTIAPVHGEDRLALTREGARWRIRGSASRLPWARYAKGMILVAAFSGQEYIALVPSHLFGEIVEGENLAREPRDRVTFDALLSEESVASFSDGLESLYMLGAAMRVMQMAGALDAVLAMTVEYVMQRKQFGRPLGKFQAIQQNIAIMAANIAAAKAASDSVTALFTKNGSARCVAAAKLRTNEAANIAAKLAHQAHGAMGYTQEYALHFLTKRLWSWRDEFGNEAIWARKLGAAVRERGADGLWPLITSDLR